MKATLSLPLRSVQNGAKRISMGLVLAVAVTFLHHDVHAISIDLGTAANFAILAGTEITDAGGPSTITGDVGLSPATGANIGLLAGQVTGTIYAVDAFGPGSSVNNPGLLTTAKNDLGTAYDAAAGAATTTDFGAGENQLGDVTRGGLALTPGVYKFGLGTTANLIGTLTLDALGNADALFIFQATSSLVTATGSSVEFINGANACNVMWQVTSSATLGSGSDFAGSILALDSITLGAGVDVDGRLLARNGLVSLINDTIFTDDCQPGTGGLTNGTSVPDTGTTLLLLGSVVATLLPFRGLFVSPA